MNFSALTLTLVVATTFLWTSESHGQDQDPSRNTTVTGEVTVGGVAGGADEGPSAVLLVNQVTTTAVTGQPLATFGWNAQTLSESFTTSSLLLALELLEALGITAGEGVDAINAAIALKD